MPRINVLLTVTLAGGFLSTAVTASTYSSHLHYTDKHPKLSPSMHTNQDDEEKSMLVDIPIGKETGLTGIVFNDPVQIDKFIDTTIVVLMPNPDTDFGGIDPIEPGLIDVGTFDFTMHGPGLQAPIQTGSGAGRSKIQKVVTLLHFECLLCLSSKTMLLSNY